MLIRSGRKGSLIAFEAMCGQCGENGDVLVILILLEKRLRRGITVLPLSRRIYEFVSQNFCMH